MWEEMDGAPLPKNIFNPNNNDQWQNCNHPTCWQKEGSQVILNDDQALMKTKCSIMQMLSCKIK